MEQIKRGNLPLVGRIQHGEQLNEGKGTRVKELGYFITKINNEYMKYLENRFNEKYPQEKKLKIRFFDENPLSIRDIRYNQGGTACYCMEGQENAKRKISGKWENVVCSEECEYKKFEKGKSKPLCNREGRLFFMIPDVTTDRIWYMKITGQTSIDNIRDYINFQKMQGKSIIGDYYLVLNQITQTNYEGKSFKNYVLEIYKEELDSKINPPIETKVIQKLENKKTEVKENKDEAKEIKKEKNPPKEPKKDTKKSVENKKEDTTKVLKEEKELATQDNNKSLENMDNFYALIGTSKKVIQKDNKPKEYVVGNFVDSEDKQVHVFIKDEDAEELSNCDLGTLVELDLATAGDKTFAKSIKYINKCKKCIKNVAA